MQNPLSTLKKTFFERPRYQRVLIYLITLYCCYAAILGLIIPFGIVSFAPEKLSQLLGRQVMIADVRINPFTFKVDIDDLVIKEKDEHIFAGSKGIQLQLNFWQSIFKGAVVIENLHLQGPNVHIRRFQTQGKAAFNFDDILITLSQNAEPATASNPNEPTKPLRVLLGQFTLDAGKFSFDDNITQANINYPSIDIKVSNLDTDYIMTTTTSALKNTIVSSAEALKTETNPEVTPSVPTEIASSNVTPQLINNHFAMQFKDVHEGEISLEGQFQLFPFMLDGDIQIAKLKLSTLWQFIDDQFDITLKDGEISAKSHYRFDLPDNGSLQVMTNRGQVILEKLNVTNQDTPVLTLPLLAIDGIAADLQRQKININQIHSDGLSLNVILDEQGVDLTKLLTPKSMAQSQASTAKEINDPTQAPNEETNKEDLVTSPTLVNTEDRQHTSEQPAPSWLVQLDKLTLENYDINLSEQKLTPSPQQWRIYPLNFATKTIVSDLKAPIEYELSFAINDKGSFASQGQVDLTSESIDAKLQMDKLALAQFQPYLAPYVNIKLKSGLLSSQGQVNADAKGQAIYRGSVELDDLNVLDNLRNAPLVKWQKMHINQLDFDQQKNQIKIDHLALNQPYAKIVIAKDRSTNISDLIVETSADNTLVVKAPPNVTVPETGNSDVKNTGNQTRESVTHDKPDLSLDIQKISFSQGSAYFADNSLTPNFASGIELLDGNISHLSSIPGTKASVDIKGKIDKYAPVTLKGDINPLLDMPYLDLDLVFKSVELTSVNPYSGTYAGYYIDKGQLSLALNYKLEHNQLKGSNHLVIDQLKLGKPSNSDLATSLPITLAIALLQDRNGIIDLGMEVLGDLDSPSFSVGSIIMTAITNVITKAVTAPFSFLASLVGSDETLDKVSFNAGSFTLDGKEQASLDKLASALTDRPMLKLSIEGEVDAINDSQAIAERMMKRKLAKLANIPFKELPTDLSPSQFPTKGALAEALAKLYEQEVKADPQLVKDAVLNEVKETPLSDEDIATRWHIALYNLSVKAQNVTEGMLGDLAQERAKTVKAYLVDTKGVAPERVFLLDSRVTLNQNTAQVNMTIDAK
ncbi:DUF748 domain-containing protein [Shewanella profunda]|uniref:DUF748 domain-containing protein n=1 Tax=Shewanella profunda TaxID=254793 RepID=UPI00200F8736|nr:DUF748 domain-containing protein [Shewanella profunda]MCL1089512.1 DUF748 domain-containing protein [Shewanella profunda]